MVFRLYPGLAPTTGRTFAASVVHAPIASGRLLMTWHSIALLPVLTARLSGFSCVSEPLLTGHLSHSGFPGLGLHGRRNLQFGGFIAFGACHSDSHGAQYVPFSQF